MERNKKHIFEIVVVILSIAIVAILGSVFVNLGMDWFSSLNKPEQWIPNIVIPIVWTIIYITFGVILSLWIIKSGLPKAVILWLIINGILNILWCLTIFTLHLTLIGNIVIILNLIASIVLFLNIFKHEKIYAIITSIYPIWLSLATSLNLAIWILN